MVRTTKVYSVPEFFNQTSDVTWKTFYVAKNHGNPFKLLTKKLLKEEFEEFSHTTRYKQIMER